VVRGSYTLTNVTINDQFCRRFTLELHVHPNEPRAYNPVRIDLSTELVGLVCVGQQLLLTSGRRAA
jgi:hypothetical protein